MRHLEAVFRRLDEAGLKLKLSKCEFFMRRLQFLGHLVSKDGIQPDFDKVKAIVKMPPPTCVKDVRAFIGMTSYYRRYMPNFSEVAVPLVKLTRKNARFDWDKECQEAFDKLKQILTNATFVM